MSFGVCVSLAYLCVYMHACVCVCKYLSCKHIKFTVVGVASAYFKSFSLYSARVYLAHKGSTGETWCACRRRRVARACNISSVCV